MPAPEPRKPINTTITLSSPDLYRAVVTDKGGKFEFPATFNLKVGDSLTLTLKTPENEKMTDNCRFIITEVQPDPTDGKYVLATIALVPISLEQKLARLNCPFWWVAHERTVEQIKAL